MLKRVRYGWVENRVYVRDYETGEIIGKKTKDDSLDYFKFGLEGTLNRNDSDRIVLHLPLIAEKKGFWKASGRKGKRVKVTIEFV